MLSVIYSLHGVWGHVHLQKLGPSRYKVSWKLSPGKTLNFFVFENLRALAGCLTKTMTMGQNSLKACVPPKAWSHRSSLRFSHRFWPVRELAWMPHSGRLAWQRWKAPGHLLLDSSFFSALIVSIVGFLSMCPRIKALVPIQISAANHGTHCVLVMTQKFHHQSHTINRLYPTYRNCQKHRTVRTAI